MTPRREDTAAVVVTWHPDAGFARRAELMSGAAARLFVIDNTPHNHGLAAGLNLGFARARDAGFAWVLAFDQDSEPLPGLLAAAARTVEAQPDPERIAAVGSNWVDAAGACHPRGPAPWEERETVITSGTVHSLAAWAAVGGFREDLFIDLVDLDWCRRVRRAGHRVLWSAEPGFRHGIGAATRHRLLGREVSTTNHPPGRRYFMARNAVALAREELLRDPVAALRIGSTLVRSLALMVLFERERGAKLRASARGIVHGVAGRLGPDDQGAKVARVRGSTP